MTAWMRWIQSNFGLLFLTTSLYGAEHKAMIPIDTQDLNSPQNLARLEKTCKKTLNTDQMQLLRVFYFTEVEGSVRFVVYTKRAPEISPHMEKKATTSERADLLTQFTSYWVHSKEPEKIFGQPLAIEVIEEPLEETNAAEEMHPPLGQHEGLLHQQSDWRSHLNSGKKTCNIL